MIYLKWHTCNYYPQFLHFRNKRIYVSVPDKNLKGMMKKNLCSSSTIHLIIKKFQTRLTKDIKGRGGVQVIIWYIKDKYLPSKSSKLAPTTWHSMHTMKNWVKWVMEFLFTNQDLNVDINCSNSTHFINSVPRGIFHKD